MDKEAVIVGVDGRYKDVEIVPDEQTGVTPIYGGEAESSEGGELAQIITGYIVAVEVPEGLYQPRWDFAAYDGYQTVVTEARLSYAQAYSDWSQEDEETRGEAPMLTLPVAPAFWVEGLTQAEIDAIRNQPQVKPPEQRIAELEAKLAIAAQAAADANDTQQQLLDYLIETGVI